MPESFSEAEKKLLKPFFSNTDRDVFVLSNLPEAVKGALFSRYSRSPKGLRRLLLDEFLQNKDLGFSELADSGNASTVPQAIVNKEKADSFYQRVLDGYGDDSVGELGGCHIALENVSMVATKIIEDARLGGSPLEKSTRYVYFDQKVDGDYLFYQEPVLMKSNFRDDYLALMRHLFDTYAKLITPVTQFMEKEHPIEEFSFMVDLATRREEKFANITEEAVRERARKAYTASIRAKTCDVLRGLLPASTLTNMGVFGNGRFFEYLLRKCYSNPLSELKELSSNMHTELDTVISAFVRRAKADAYLMEKEKRLFEVGRGLNAPPAPLKTGARLIDFDPQAEEKLLVYCLFAQVQSDFDALTERVSKLNSTQRMQLLRDYTSNRRTRRDRPGRAFENTYYTFEILADFGIYRDLQRHRVLTQERQLLSTLHGFDLPSEIVAAGFEKEFSNAMARADELYRRISVKHPFEAQYAVPMAYRIRWYFTLNFREAMHLIELRSTRQGHEAYRRVAQQMYHEIKRVHPALAALMNFVDLESYSLSRLDAEMKQEHRRAEWKK